MPVTFVEGHTGVAMISFFFSGMDRTFRTYLELLRRPGAARPAAGTALASLPIGMLGLSVLLLVQRSTGRFAAAGAVVGLLALGTGVGILAQGRLIDRFGPPRVLLPAVALQLPALLALVLAARASAGMWTLGSMALVAGACEPQVGGSLRGLWSVLAPAEQRQAAIALSSTLFEVAVVTGPLLLVAVLAVTGPAGGFTTLTAAGLGATAAGNAAAGWLVERGSPPLALLAVAIAALAGAALTLLRRASLGSPPHRASPPPG